MSGSIGYDARLLISTEANLGRTKPKSIYFNAPFKLTNYFRLDNGGIEYMLMSASAGIMAEDNYNIEIEVGDNSILVLTAQSFEKIHKMESGAATRTAKIKVGTDAYFKYFPLPTIPFADSNYTNSSYIQLQNYTSKLIYSEILTSGRYLSNERFEFSYYKSLLDISLQGKLIFRDNSIFEPKHDNLECFGMFEGYSHLANLLIFGLTISNDLADQINQRIARYGLDGAITTLNAGGNLIRVFANGSEGIINCFKEIVALLELVNGLT